MIAVLLLAAFIPAAIWGYYIRKNWDRGLAVKVLFRESAVYASGRAHLEEVIENRGKLPLPVLEVGFRIGKGVSFADEDNTQVSDYVYKRDVFSLLGRECIRRNHELICEKRGLYRISQVSCSARPLLYGKVRSREESSDSELYVYAARTDIAGLLPQMEVLLGERESARRVYEDPFAFAGIRPYTSSDPMKTVNWKASARSGDLMVNTYSSVQAEQVTLYLDVSDPYIVKSPKLTEESISLAATLAESLLRKGLEVGLETNAAREGGEEPLSFPRARGREQLKKIEQFLTSDMDAFRAVPFRQPRGEETAGVRVLISKNATPELQEEMLGILGREGSGVWVIPVRSGDSLRILPKGPLRLIRREVL